MIFVLISTGEIFVLNHNLFNDQNGLIYKFRNPYTNTKLVDFFLLNELDWQQALETSGNRRLQQLEEKLRGAVKPMCRVLSVSQRATNIWELG